MDWPFFKKSKFSTENIKKSFGFMYVNPISKLLNESQKGLDPNKASNTFNIKDVEEHPVDFSMMQGIYDKSGIVTSVINKYIDYIIGGGFYVTSENPTAQALIEQFNQDINMDQVLRLWIKDSMITGSGFTEKVKNSSGLITDLIVHAPNYLFKKINGFGTVIGYKQVFGKGKEVEFKPDEIAYLPFNKRSGSTYGIGLIYPAIEDIDSRIGNKKQRNILLERKANAPIHVTLGDREKGMIPSQEDVDAYGKKLEWMRNDQEWCTDPYVDMKVLSFGDIGSQFSAVLKDDMKDILKDFDIPEVLIGEGSIPEGLAKYQSQTWAKRIVSIQSSIEVVMENDIYGDYLASQGIQAKIEVHWGEISKIEKEHQLTTITETLKNPMISPQMAVAMEERLAKIMELEVKVPPAIERKKEEEEPQARVPGQNNKKAVPPQNKKKEHVHSEECNCINDFVTELSDISDASINLTVKEWVEFDYKEYMDEIIKFVVSEKFNNREYVGFKYTPGTNQREWVESEVKYQLTDNLSKKQVTELQGVLKNSFEKNQSIRDISKSITEKVKPSDLKVKVPDVTDSTGKVIRRGYELTIPSDIRSILMARTETVRASNNGALNFFKNNGLEKAQWISSVGERTCSYCIAQNGRQMKIGEAMERIPVHVGCFISPKIPIHTSKGLKNIGDIKIGDKVLTHTGTYKSVTKLIDNIKYNGELIKIDFNIPQSKSMKSIEVTPEHPFLIGDKWVEAKDLKEDDNLTLLAIECDNCGKLIPDFTDYVINEKNIKTCCDSCKSKAITKIQYKDENQHILRSEKAKKQMEKEGIQEIFRICKNHSGEYKFITSGIKKITKRKLNHPKKLYNFAVEEDESYMAKGVVTHNCRCTWIGVLE